MESKRTDVNRWQFLILLCPVVYWFFHFSATALLGGNAIIWARGCATDGHFYLMGKSILTEVSATVYYFVMVSDVLALIAIVLLFVLFIVFGLQHLLVKR